MNARKVIYKVKGARVIQDQKTGALEFFYSIQGLRWKFTTWSEVGAKAQPLFTSFWKEHGIKNPLLELETVDLSDKLPTRKEQVKQC